MRARFVLLALLAGLAPGLASGTGPKMLTGEEIKALFTGNTVAGTYVNGGAFSEFHAVDGRAIGDNGYTLNVDACWNTDGDKVCYHYGPFKDRRTYCFTVEQTGDNLLLRVAGSGKLNATGRVETGNPRDHGDGGRRWSCDDLLSRAPVQPAPDARQRALDAFQPGAKQHETAAFHSAPVYDAPRKLSVEPSQSDFRPEDR